MSEGYCPQSSPMVHGSTTCYKLPGYGSVELWKVPIQLSVSVSVDTTLALWSARQSTHLNDGVASSIYLLTTYPTASKTAYLHGHAPSLFAPVLTLLIAQVRYLHITKRHITPLSTVLGTLRTQVATPLRSCKGHYAYSTRPSSQQNLYLCYSAVLCSRQATPVPAASYPSTSPCISRLFLQQGWMQVIASHDSCRQVSRRSFVASQKMRSDL